MSKSVVYLITVEYVDETMSIKSICDFVELVDETDASDIKSTIRVVMGVPVGSPIKIISMCPMMHLTLED